MPIRRISRWTRLRLAAALSPCTIRAIRREPRKGHALDQVRWAHEIGLPSKMRLMDAAYGNDSRLRAGVMELRMAYVAGVQAQTLVWKPGVRAACRRRGDAVMPNTISVKELALSLKAKA